MELTWVGHATTLIDVDGYRVLTDPLLTKRVAHLRRRRPLPSADTFDVDLVLLSHVHVDHLHLPVAQATAALRPGARHRPAPHRCCARRASPTSPRSASATGSNRGPVTVEVVPAEHKRGRGPHSRVSADPVGFIVNGAGRRIYFPGDTDLFDAMADFGDIDVALLPIWGWGSTLGEGHLNPTARGNGHPADPARVARPDPLGNLRSRGWPTTPASLVRRAADRAAHRTRRHRRTPPPRPGRAGRLGHGDQPMIRRRVLVLALGVTLAACTTEQSSNPGPTLTSTTSTTTIAPAATTTTTVAPTTVAATATSPPETTTRAERTRRRRRAAAHRGPGGRLAVARRLAVRPVGRPRRRRRRPVAPSIGPGTAVTVSNLGSDATGQLGESTEACPDGRIGPTVDVTVPIPDPPGFGYGAVALPTPSWDADTAPAGRVDAWAGRLRSHRGRGVRRGTRRRNARSRRPTRGDRPRRRRRRRGARGVRVRAGRLDSRRTRRSRLGPARRRHDPGVVDRAAVVRRRGPGTGRVPAARTLPDPRRRRLQRRRDAWRLPSTPGTTRARR